MIRSYIKTFYARRLRRIISQLSRKWIRTTGRVRSALVFSADSDLRIIKSSLRYEPIQVSTPKFFINHPIQTGQLKDYLENPNLRPYDAKIIDARQVRVMAPSMVHRWKNNAFIEALLEDEANISYPRLVLDFELLPFRSTNVWPVGVLLALPLFSNYFHWMVELLPRLLLLEEHPELNDLPLIVPADAPSFVRETLQLSGYLEQVQFVRQGAHQFCRLYIPSSLSPPSHPSPKAISWLRSTIAASILPVSPIRGRRIYVSRRDASTRYATNESAVEALLQQFGFETAIMSDYTVAEQIILFAQAEVIVGIHGAALTNLIFCAQGTYVLELFLEGWFTNAFYHISLIQRLHYGYLVCARDGEGQCVPIENLRMLILEIIKHSVTRQTEISCR